MADFLELRGCEENNFFKLAKTAQQIKGSLVIKITRELKHLVLNDDALITFSLSGTLDEEEKPHLIGEIKGDLKLQCQRCLEDLDFNLDISFDYLLSSKEEEEFLDQRILFCRESSNLLEFLEEEILLSLPMIAKHEHCSLPIELNSEQDITNNPFAELKTLFNKE